jgi:hypothetical protein
MNERCECGRLRERGENFSGVSSRAIRLAGESDGWRVWWRYVLHPRHEADGSEAPLYVSAFHQIDDRRGSEWWEIRRCRSRDQSVRFHDGYCRAERGGGIEEFFQDECGNRDTLEQGELELTGGLLQERSLERNRFRSRLDADGLDPDLAIQQTSETSQRAKFHLRIAGGRQ